MTKQTVGQEEDELAFCVALGVVKRRRPELPDLRYLLS